MSSLWSPFVNSLEPYVPGQQSATSGIIKLNTNENPYPPSPRVQDTLRQLDADSLRLYPDPESTELSTCIASYHNVEAGQVFVGNGSDEVLAHAFNAFFRQDKPLCFPDITYSFYPVYCRLYNIDFKRIPLDDNFVIDWTRYPQEAGGIIFANPNAPTGIFQSADDIERVLQAHPNTVVVVDEAYIDFVKPDASGSDLSAIPLLAHYPNLVVTRTVSKSRSLAGLRIGYALASVELIDGLKRVKNSFNSYPVDAVASAVTQASFSDEDCFQSTCQRVVDNREQLVAALESLGFESLDSSANFIMTRHATLPSAEIYAALKASNVWVRYFNAPRLKDFIRISIGSADENGELLSSLKRILAGDN